MWAFTEISLKQLTWFNGHDTLKFTFSSEHAVSWIFTNNESNFAELFVNSSNVSVTNVSCPLSIETVFKMSISWISRDFGLPLPARRVTAEPISSDGKSSAECSISSFCQDNLFLSLFSIKSLLAKSRHVHFVSITQFIHHNNIKKCQ